MDSSGVTATKSQVYGMAGFCLIFGVVILILAALLYMQSANFPNPANVVKGVKTTNGVAGSIANSQLTLKFTNNGLLSGPGFNAATGPDVTRMKLAGFNTDSIENQITASDSILSASENVVLMGATPLELTSSTLGPVVGTGTIIQAASHLKGQVQNFAPQFSMWALQSSLGQGTTLLSLVPAGSYHGSLVIPANTIVPGNTMQILITGDIYSTASVIGASNVSFTMGLTGSDSSTIAYANVTNVASTTNYSTNGNSFQVKMTLSGDGGDELFMGYLYLRQTHLVSLYIRGIWQLHQVTQLLLYVRKQN